MQIFKWVVLCALVTLGAWPVQAQARNFEIWVANQGLDKIQILDGQTLHVSGEIEIDTDGQPATSKPHMVLFSPDGQYAFVANVGSGMVTIIQADTRRVVQQIPTGRGAHAPVPSPDGQRVFVANPAENTVTEILIDMRRGVFQLGRTIPTGTRPICLMFSADSKKAYVSLGGDPQAADPTQTGGIEIIDVELGAVVQRFENTGKNGCGLIRSTDGTKMYANVGEPVDRWMVFDAKSDTLLYSGSTVSKDAHAMWVHPNGQELWIFGRQDNQAVIFDPMTYQELGRVSVRDKPDIADASPDGAWLFVALRGQAVTGDPHALSGTTPGVAVIDVVKRAHVRTISLMGDPHGLAVRSIAAGAVGGSGSRVVLVLLALLLVVVLVVLRR
jgi:YVTN family beta-propeller protein